MRKRILDLLLIVVSSPLWLPAFLLVALLVRIGLGTPVFFRQVRPGLHGKPFKLVKFRTLSDERGADGRLLPDEQRMTRLGRWLRASSLDELPEFFNILKGEMSLVGPRPLMMNYLPLYSPEQARRHNVLPGLTGWAQIHGRNAVDWEKRFALDAWYVDNRTLWLDLKILAATVALVFRRDGIQGEDAATMKPFNGNQKKPPEPEEKWSER